MHHPNNFLCGSCLEGTLRSASAEPSNLLQTFYRTDTCCEDSAKYLMTMFFKVHRQACHIWLKDWTEWSHVDLSWFLACSSGGPHEGCMAINPPVLTIICLCTACHSEPGVALVVLYSTTPFFNRLLFLYWVALCKCRLGAVRWWWQGGRKPGFCEEFSVPRGLGAGTVGVRPGYVWLGW